MTDHQFYTLIIAIAGFLLAMASLGWNIVVQFLSKPKLEISASLAFVVPLPHGITVRDTTICISAVNMRTRPVTVVGFNMITSQGIGYFLKPDARFRDSVSLLPKRLSEGDDAKTFVLTASLPNKLEEVKYFFARDSAGREWLSRPFPLLDPPPLTRRKRVTTALRNGKETVKARFEKLFRQWTTRQ